MKFRIFLVVAVSYLMIGLPANGTTRTAVASNKWETASTWSGGVVPVCGDTVIIGSGKTVQVTSILDFSACSQSMFISISGTLTFQTGKKLKLPCSSVVDVAHNGIIAAGSGGGNSNLIDICGITVWNAAQGDLTGPITLQFNPLPVQLVHFSVKPDRDAIVLTWLTLSEVNNDFFTVEKCRDGIHFEELGRIAGSGNSSNMSSYQMTDKNPFEGLQYYRLKQTDFDGHFTYSKPIAIRWKSDAEFQVYPNPTRGELFANLHPKYAGQPVRMYINKSTGNLVRSGQFIIGESSAGIPLLNLREYLKPGSYIVTIETVDASFSQFIICK